MSEALSSWNSLNEFLMGCNEETAAKLLVEEKKHRKRKQFMLRIHSRLNKLRADREREEIVRLAK